MNKEIAFEPRFPWHEPDLYDLKKLTHNPDVESIKIRWYWEPFHRPGFNALNYAQKKQMSTKTFARRIRNLSCPEPPKWLRSKTLEKMKKENLLGIDGELKPLDVTNSIEKTLEEARGHISEFEGSLLLKISDLKNLVGEHWTPEISGLAETTEVSSWLTNDPRLLNRFHESEVWVRLELLETLSGMFNSSSVLNFTRIYTE